MDRVILHCDLNSFYASVEALYHPEYQGLPLAVGGDVERRHGIILAKNELAKQYQVKTGEALWQAKKKCPQLVIIQPNHEKYTYFSNRVREIFQEYTDLIEPFGIDEAWLDVTNSKIFGDGKTIADTIRQRIKNELGITASVGVSYNKVYAKLGSDYKKPDATTIISKENQAQVVYPLAVDELLYIGKATAQLLKYHNIKTIGELVSCGPERLTKLFGKNGKTLWQFASGNDESPVSLYSYQPPIKSISNSCTPREDIYDLQQAKICLMQECENIAYRLRKDKIAGQTIAIYLRDNKLKSFTRQAKLKVPTQSSEVILKQALKLVQNNYYFDIPLRSIGVQVSELVPESQIGQLSLFEDENRNSALDKTLDNIKDRFGLNSITKAVLVEHNNYSDYCKNDSEISWDKQY